MNPKKINCLAVDDEPPALQVIEKYVSSIPLLELTATCNNAVHALAVLQSDKIDLLFLDIQMPHILGTDFIRTLSNPPKVIFTTAFRKYAIEGFDLDAVDYLLKPISFERFLKAINKVMNLNLQVGEQSIINSPNKNTTTETFLYLRADRKNIRVNFDDILFIESLRDYIKVVTKEKTIVTKQSISSLEETLPQTSFIRTHRSFIVSVGKIEFFRQDLIQICDYEIPISRSYQHQVERALSVKRRAN
ncbi:MAG: LytTR family DNA-binding domain-containing protein [Ferruginibacter sp.]